MVGLGPPHCDVMDVDVSEQLQLVRNDNGIDGLDDVLLSDLEKASKILVIGLLDQGREILGQDPGVDELLLEEFDVFLA